MKLKCISFFVFIFFNSALYAQSITLIYKKENKEETKKFANRTLLITYLKKEQSKYIALGYLEARIDTVIENNFIRAKLLAGEQYITGTIKLKRESFTFPIKSGKIINSKTFSKIAEKEIEDLENNGYPFARVEFDSVSIQDRKLSAIAQVIKGPAYKIDSLVIKGDIKVMPEFVYRYCGLKPGDSYNENAVKNLDRRIKEIPFAQIIKPSEILFTRKQCIIYVYLKKKNASSFNGILGILPDSRTGKTTITGDARVNLKNAIGKSESFDLNWRKIANKTQDLKVNLLIPYWFKSPVGTEMNLKLYKRDTSFLEFSRSIGLTWQMTRGNLFRIFYNRYNSNILSKTFYTGTGNSNLQNSDMSVNNYGIGFKFEKLDYRLNPRKGFFINIEGTAGIKKIFPNSVNDASLYANESLRSEYYTGNFNIDGYIPIGKSFTFKTSNSTRFIANQKIYRNELLRIGGIKTLRGFDEESILASAYSISTAEFRFIFDENSSFFIFTDQAWYENNSTLGYKKDQPSAYGLGVNFQVKTGVFTFTWALGKQASNPMLIKNSKLHFGFINYF